MEKNEKSFSHITAEEHCVDGFSIQDYAFKFPNQFESSPFYLGPVVVGDAQNGLCGGMAAAAACYYRYRTKVPTTVQPPGSSNMPELFEYLKECQWATTNTQALWKYGYWTLEDPVGDKNHVRDAWPFIKSAIDKNEPALIGLIRSKTTLFNLGKNIFNRAELQKPFINHHQVLAYAYKRQDEHVILSIYDPAFPSEDNIKLLFDRDGSNLQHIKQLPNYERQDLGKVFSLFSVDYKFAKKPPGNDTGPELKTT